MFDLQNEANYLLFNRNNYSAVCMHKYYIGLLQSHAAKLTGNCQMKNLVN
jgi:hypothetical protein